MRRRPIHYLSRQESKLTQKLERKKKEKKNANGRGNGRYLILRIISIFGEFAKPNHRIPTNEPNRREQNALRCRSHIFTNAFHGTARCHAHALKSKIHLFLSVCVCVCVSASTDNVSSNDRCDGVASCDETNCASLNIGKLFVCSHHRIIY